jgi:hypothetical protein
LQSKIKGQRDKCREVRNIIDPLHAAGDGHAIKMKKNERLAHMHNTRWTNHTPLTD